MLGKTHFYSGIIIVLVFLLTGQYMDHKFGHLQEMELMNRALFRAGHLYILLFGLINAALGINFHETEQGLWGKIQIFGSIATLFASLLVIYAFFVELPTEHIERPLTRYGLYLILLGISLHGLVYLYSKLTHGKAKQ